jgi:hypothetical protein
MRHLRRDERVQLTKLAIPRRFPWRRRFFNGRGTTNLFIPNGDAIMAYRNKPYVCFDGDNDIRHYTPLYAIIRHYRLMQAWTENEKFTFNFYNAHDLNTARDDSQEESIKRQLRERFANSNKTL